MSGHSKWANIKHQKEAADRKKGKSSCSCGGNCGGHGSVDINALTSMIVAELKKVM